MNEILRLEGVSKTFGGVKAVSDVSFSLQEGEIVGLIGPNGAGKTTLVNLVTGVHPLSGGKVVFAGRDVSRQKPFEAARRGLARTFQIVQPFPDMTVVENVAAGALFGGGLRTRQAAEEEARRELAFVGLDRFAESPAAALTLPNRKPCAPRCCCSTRSTRASTPRRSTAPWT
jgi:branched-chain amino acid transport system ATP-binding protein